MFATIAGPYPDLDAAAGDGLRAAVVDQLESGLGMVGDGGVHRIESDRDGAMAIDAWRAADSIARERAAVAGIEPALVKACLMGPYDTGWAAHPANHAARRRGTLAAAERLHEVIGALIRAGAPVVQLEESSLTRVAADDHVERGLVRAAWRCALADHPGHVSLAVLRGSADAAGADLLYDAPFASYLFDLIAGPDNWRLAAEAPPDRGLIVGVGDARTVTPDTEAVLIWGARYAASLGGRGPERVGLAPSAGLESLARDVARTKLAVLAEAARKATLPADELAASIDPRAVDARSAAMGRYQPGARRRR